MATFSTAASSLGYTFYGAVDWYTESTDGACQGAYQGTSIDDSRVGFMLFSGAGETLRASNISEIALTITCSSSGRNESDRVLTLCKSNYQTMPTTEKGSAVFGDVLGTLTGNFYNNTVTYTLNATTNAALFAAMKSYFQAGNSALVTYNGEWEPRSGYSSSYNFIRVLSTSITVTYSEPTTKPCGREWVNGAWRKYELYTCDSGVWRLRVVRDGATVKPEELTYVTYPAAAMTSNSSQNCVVSASTEYSTKYKAYMAFDNEESASWASKESDTEPWIQIQIPNALKNITVTVYARTHTASANPVAGYVVGSTDGATWTQIGSYSGWNPTQKGGVLGEIVCNNKTAYQYIRLAVTEKANEGYDYTAIGYITVSGGMTIE